MRVVIMGLSITSSWGNGHATMFRGLVRALTDRGHEVLFLERDKPWYAANRDMPDPPFGTTRLYDGPDDLQSRFAGDIAAADLVIVGSYVPNGVSVAQFVFDYAQGVTAFYDIDTPITVDKLARGDYEYLSPEHVRLFDLYLSFTGGPLLTELEERWGAKRARPLYCAFDPEVYYPEQTEPQWDLGYLGTYSADRQPGVDRLLLDVAKNGRGKFIVAGPGFPDVTTWPENVEHVFHLSPEHHRSFYNRQRFTLNITRAEMRRVGYAPSVRLFEAAGCGTPVISDWWPGLDEFFAPGAEIAIAANTREASHHLWDMNDEERKQMAARARSRVLERHTMAHRAAELEQYVKEAAVPARS